MSGSTRGRTFTQYASQVGGLAVWGDSLAAGDGGSTAASRWMPTLAAALTPPRDLYRGGVGGTTSTQARNAALLATANRNYIQLIWTGHNDPTDTALVIRNINEIIAWMTVAPSSRQYLVLSPVQNASNAVGSGGYLAILALRTALASAFGARYIDVNAALAAASSGNAQDISDVANGYTPTSLRADTIHLADAGQDVVKAALLTTFTSLGWQ